MKKVNAVLLMFIVLSTMSAFFTSTPATAAPKMSTSVAYVTRYVWRGQDLLSDNDPAIQPSLTFALPINLSFNIWGSYGFGGASGKNLLNELDFTLSYAGTINKDISYTVGHYYYTFHHLAAGSPKESQETFAGVSFPNAALKPSITLYGDWGSSVSKGYYLSVAGSRDFKLGIVKKAPSLTLNLSAGYCDGQWRMEPGVSDINLGISTSLTIGKTIVTPAITYTYVPHKGSSAKGDTVPPKINLKDEIWGSLNFSF
jgi:uncharacterized protein (TIGR02001 family)